MAKNRPAHQIRLGRIKAVIWANQTSNGIMHSVSISRIYKDGEQWKSTESLKKEDLLIACKALDLAHTWIFETTTDDAGSEVPS